jgi:hypothetical protein
MSMEKDDLGRYVVKLNESAAIIVEQIETRSPSLSRALWA